MDEVPKKWKKLGKIIIISLPEVLKPFSEEIGESFLNNLQPRPKSVVTRSGITKTPFRIPQFEIIAGKSTTTIHKELNCFFALDIASITFSPGNHYERKRLVEKISSEFVLVDMFACVGNLSIPVSVHCQAEVFGIEVSSSTFEYLLQNIRLNRIEDRYHPVLGDNRLVTPQNIADHVFFGYWGVDNKQLSTGIISLKKETGGWLYIHQCVRNHKGILEYSWEAPAEERVTEILQNEGIPFEVLEFQTRKVKNVQKYVDHIVTDIRLVPRFTD